MALFEQFVNHVEKEHLFAPTDTVLLAVSGGVDSVVMADLFAKAGYPFGIAHCNFHLRGDDSNSDEAFVRALAQKYQVPFHCTEFDTTAFAKEHKLSIEEAARNLRYDFFEEIRQEHGYRYIATAHHLNDSIETFFINLIRGTGITGLHGILPKNGNIVRPLLPFTRQQIADYTTESSLHYHNDYTNNETVFLRNKIRHQLVPLLKEMSPQIEQTMMRNISNIADAEQIFHNSIAEKRVQLFEYKGDEIRIPKEGIRQLTPCNTYMFELLRPFGFNATTINDLLSAMDSTGRQFHSTTHTLITDRNYIIIKPVEAVTSPTETSIPYGTTSISQPINLLFNTLPSAEIADLHTDSDTIIVDSEKLKYPLLLRKWQPNDRFRPFGMKGSRKLSDFFKDNHLTLFEKEEKWLLCNADGKIIWVVCMRMDDTFKISDTTTKATTIKFLHK